MKVKPSDYIVPITCYVDGKVYKHGEITDGIADNATFVIIFDGLGTPEVLHVYFKNDVNEIELYVDEWYHEPVEDEVLIDMIKECVLTSNQLINDSVPNIPVIEYMGCIIDTYVKAMHKMKLDIDSIPKPQ